MKKSIEKDFSELKMQPTENKQAVVKWYYRPFGLCIAFLCFGPFALPLVWKSPVLNNRLKIIISVLTMVFTYFLIMHLTNFVKITVSHFQEINKVLQ